MPFARPHLDDVLAMIDHVTARNLPPRGEFEGDEAPRLAAE
jgi:hypothetical protein